MNEVRIVFSIESSDGSSDFTAQTEYLPVGESFSELAGLYNQIAEQLRQLNKEGESK